MTSMSDLNERAAKRVLGAIGQGLIRFAENREGEDCISLLEQLEGVFDDLSMDDFFGTEGWKHYFGI